MKVKVVSSERFTYAAKDYHAGNELEIPDAYAATYIKAGYVDKVKERKARKK